MIDRHEIYHQLCMGCKHESVDDSDARIKNRFCMRWEHDGAGFSIDNIIVCAMEQAEKHREENKLLRQQLKAADKQIMEGRN